MVKTLYIGTAGYNYTFWKGSFYPDGAELEYYATKFNCVEIDYTYYRYPTISVIKGWYQKTPADFRFVIKMNRLITHYKKLSGVKTVLRQFMDVVKHLKEKLSCILFQFPRNFHCTTENMNRLKKLRLPNKIPNKINYAFEFRDASWYSQPVYDLFKTNDWLFVTVVRKEIILPDNQIKTYFRLHGPTGLYTGSYNLRILERIKKLSKTGGYVIFNNTDSITRKLPDAVYDALRLQKL